MNNNKKYDFAGIFFSLICGIHCIITPILIINFPKLGEKFESPWVQLTLLVLIAGIFYQSVYKSFKIHRSKLTLSLGLSGFFILIYTYISELLPGHELHSMEAHHQSHGHNHVEEPLTIALAIVGSVLMISSHLFNIKFCRCAED